MQETLWGLYDLYTLTLYMIVALAIITLILSTAKRTMSTLRITRSTVQIMAFILFAWIPLTPLILPVLWEYAPLVVTYEKNPRCICLFGAVQHIFADFSSNQFPLLAIIGLAIFTPLLFGRAMCGWLCPIGMISDVIGRFRILLKKTAFKISQRFHDRLRMIKYAELFLVLLIVSSVGVSSLADLEIGFAYREMLPSELQRAPACSVCPTPVIFRIVPDAMVSILSGHIDLPLMTFIGLFIFFAFVIFSLLVPSFFCRYFCFLGAIVAPFNKVSALSILKNHQKCTDCGACQRYCPMDVRRVKEELYESKVNDTECIRCLTCINVCPEKALSLNLLGEKIYDGGSRKWMT